MFVCPSVFPTDCVRLRNAYVSGKKRCVAGNEAELGYALGAMRGRRGGGGKKGSWYEIIGVFLLHISNIDLYDKSKLAHKG